MGGRETAGFGWDNCDPALSGWVREICDRIAAELASHHVGTYLHGSLAAGSFFPPKSDVDVLFVVDDVLDPETRRRCAIAAASGNGMRPITGSLECSVVRQRALDALVHPMDFEVHFGEEWTDDILAGRFDFELERTDPDLAAHVQATCEFGVVLAGPPVADVFTPFARADFVDSVSRDLAWILDGENILESPFYGVLNTARILWVLEEVSPRLVPSKNEAGEWLVREAPKRHQDVIRMALDVYRDATAVSPAERRTGGRAWPRDALLDLRDWARERVGVEKTGGA